MDQHYCFFGYRCSALLFLRLIPQKKTPDEWPGVFYYK
jgi:hypothetical protein